MNKNAESVGLFFGQRALVRLFAFVAAAAATTATKIPIIFMLTGILRNKFRQAHRLWYRRHDKLGPPHRWCSWQL